MNPICDCKRARHIHGDNVMYSIHKCRCAVCREARSSMERRRRKEKLYGRHYLTDAEAARAHVRSLMDAGMGWKRVAKAAGVSPSSVYPLLYGRGGDDPRPLRKQISKALEAKLLAVSADMAPGSIVDSLGSIRRLQALASMGWSQHRLAGALGMFPGNFGKIIHGDRSGILVATERRIQEIFDANWDKAPEVASRFEQAGVTRAKREAAAKGWVTAAAWDDIDDPAETPKADLVDDSIDPRERSIVSKVDHLELLILDGYGDSDGTYVRAGWSSRASAWKSLQRSGRLGLVERLQRNDRARQPAA